MHVDELLFHRFQGQMQWKITIIYRSKQTAEKFTHIVGDYNIFYLQRKDRIAITHTLISHKARTSYSYSKYDLFIHRKIPGCIKPFTMQLLLQAIKYQVVNSQLHINYAFQKINDGVLSFTLPILLFQYCSISPTVASHIRYNDDGNNQNLNNKLF